MAKIMVNSQAPRPSIASSSNGDSKRLAHLLVNNSNEITTKPIFTAREAQVLASRLFCEIGIETSVLDAQLLLGEVLGVTRLEIQLSGCIPLDPLSAKKYWQLVKRRLCFEPVAYILGQKEFFGHTFTVSKDCLIPRPDTEVVVEKCLERLEKSHEGLFFDVCTGSGAIAISILRERTKMTAVASDISSRALNVARTNAKNLGVIDRLSFLPGDLFAPFGKEKKASLIVANPPYIGSTSMDALPADVRDFEPWLALEAKDPLGLSFYQRILEDAPEYLCVGGFLIVEIGFDQADMIRRLVGKSWQIMEVFKDLAGNDRGFILKKRSI